MKTTAARDFTVKIEVTGLQPNTQYWYQFKKDADLARSARSRPRRTRTSAANSSSRTPVTPTP